MGERPFIDWIEDWSQLLGGCNWYTFRFAQFEVEWGKMLGGVEATIIILGLGARVRWNYTQTEEMDKIVQMVDEIKEKD